MPWATAPRIRPWTIIGLIIPAPGQANIPRLRARSLFATVGHRARRYGDVRLSATVTAALKIAEGGEPRMGKLDGKVALVTGAARGLGRAYAKRLSGLGARLAVADINLRSYEEFDAEAQDMTGDTTVAEIEAAGGMAMGIDVDIRDDEAVKAMVAQVVEKWGRLDVLVANAGGGRGRPMDTRASSLDPELLHLVTEMNLFGTISSCNAVAPIMKQQRFGKIITVSSVAGTAPSADGGYAHYGAAKAAIAHYTRYLAQDLGPFGITANCIAPGVIATGRIMATVIPGSSQSNRDRAELVALRRLGTVEDCAKVVEFLATDLSDYVTGAVIPIDGGLVRG
jgi:3-oxoacyl-[acyl-carrier protein] reductase